MVRQGVSASMTTDYASSTEDPRPYLRRIAEAGFTHVHWCQQWNTPYLYAEEEVDLLRALLAELGLRLLDLHGLVRDPLYFAAAGRGAREEGLALVANRIRMAARLGSDTIILHPPEPKGHDWAAIWDGVRRFIDSLVEVAAPLGVRLAMENLQTADTWEMIHRLLGLYDARAVGLCYDSGHGNMVPGSLDRLEELRGRLFSVHLHDNDGSADQHRLPFTGTVDWDRLSAILAGSSYDRSISLESNTHTTGEKGEEAERVYLREALAAAQRLTAMVEAHRCHASPSCGEA